jgi:D-glycero-D-manno-heptose 1,7-bisphosphate phosphatase
MNPALPARHKAAFLDRDGVINHERHYLYRPEHFEFIEGVFDACRHLQALGYRLIVVTNQSGIARGLYTEVQFQALSVWMCAQFAAQQVRIDAVYHCPHLHMPDAPVSAYNTQCQCRKPRPGMLQRAIRDFSLDPAQCLMVGDKGVDMQAAAAAGVARKILVQSGHTLSDADRALADEVWPSLGSALACVQN